MSVKPAEFKLGVREDDAPAEGVCRSLAVQLQAPGPDLPGQLPAEQLRQLLEGDVDVMPGRFLGGRREDRFRQAVGLAQSGGHPDAADGSESLVFLERGTFQVTADDAFRGQHVDLAHQHGSSGQLVRIG